MTAYLIDTYAWVEYFVGSSKGEILRTLFLKKTNTFYTVDCCLGELQAWSLREEKDFHLLLHTVHANSTILPLTEEDWILAGEERFQLRKTRAHFGLIDATLLVQQKKLECKIISGDSHFSGLKNVIFLQ